MFGWVNRADCTSYRGSSADERFTESLKESGENADGQIFWFLNAQWAVILCTSFALASEWNSAGLGQLWAAAVWVGILSAVPMWLVLRSPGTRRSRFCVAVSQGLLSSMLWYVSGGKAETHLHLYTWLAVLSLYRDVPTLVTAGVVALLGHAVILSGSVLPELTTENSPHWFWLVIWLAGLAVETVFLAMYVVLDRQTRMDCIRQVSTANTLNSRLEHTVPNRTQALAKDCERLQTEVAILNDRLDTTEASRVTATCDVAKLRTDVTERGVRIQFLVRHLVNTDLPDGCSSQIEVLQAEVQQLIEMVKSPQHKRPVVAPSPAPAPRGEPKCENRAKPSGGSDSEEKRALLLVKNIYQQKRAVKALEAEGYVVDVAANGPRAYYSVMLNDYAVIVVDIDLPNEEGFDTLEALRLLPTDRIRDSKCLFALTTALEPDRVLRCTELEVDGIFVKPLKAEALRQSLSTATSRECEDRQTWAWTGASLSR